MLGACSLGGAGHLQPLVPFLDAARRREHETLVVGPSTLAALVQATGHPFLAGGTPPEADVAPIREQLPTVDAGTASVLGNRELFGRLATQALLPDLERAIARWRPDVVLRDPCEYASAVIAPHHGVAVAQVAIGLAAVEWGSIDVAAPALEAHRAGLADEVRRTPYLTRFPATLDPSPFPDTRRFREPHAEVERPLPRWWEGAEGPLVYASFGTVLGHMSVAGDTFRTLLRAVATVEGRVLLTVGRHVDVALLGALPGNVHVEQWVDQAEVLPHADLVVCHGGSGTTFGALAAGVPVVVVPLFADQFANGARVARTGAGVVVGAERDASRRPLGRDDAPRIAAAIGAVLGSARHRERARRVAAEMAAAPTPDEVLDELTAP